MNLQIHIKTIAEGLQEEYKYSNIEYVKHEFTNRQGDTDDLTFIIYYEVG